MTHLGALCTALNARDEYTSQHSKRVVDLALSLGRKCDLSDAELHALNIASHLHDIGKIGIPDRILLKPTRFIPEEWEVMMRHPTIGESIIRSSPFQYVEEVAMVVRHHHEAFNGSGYPDQLRGRQIPKLARILTIADCYDAIGTARPYHASRPHGKVMEIMSMEAGQKFDPHIFSVFAELIEDSTAKIAA